MPFYNAGTEKFQELIDGMVAKSLRKQLDDILQDYLEPKWVSIKQACERLDISRQTLNNWRKAGDSKWVLDRNTKKVGGKVMVNIAGLESGIRDFRFWFKHYTLPEERIENLLKPRIVDEEIEICYQDNNAYEHENDYDEIDE